MKTWKRLEAMAKRQGLVIERGRHEAAVYRRVKGGYDDHLLTACCWLGPKAADPMLRAMIEAALGAGK